MNNLPPEIATNVVQDDFADLLDDTGVDPAEQAPPISEEHQPEDFRQESEKQAEEDPQVEQSNPSQAKVSAALAELIVLVTCTTHNSFMKWIAEEQDGSRFAISVSQKKELTQATQKVIQAYDFNGITPVHMLLIMAVITFLPSTMQAFEIKGMKDRFKREEAEKQAAREAKVRGEAPPPKAPPTATAAATATATFKNKGGRPPGTTKEAMELRRKLEKRR